MISRIWHHRRHHNERVSINDLEKYWTADEYGRSRPKMDDDAVTYIERVKHITWANFALPMSTSSLAVLFAQTPHRFPGLTTIGKVIFIIVLVLFLVLSAAITTRFVLVPGSLKKSLLHPTEALFFPTAPLAVSNIISCIQLYAVPDCGPWLRVTVLALFWIYTGIAFIIAVVQYFDLFTAPAQRLTIQSMTPGWILPIFPVMTSGTLAVLIATGQEEQDRMPIIVAGVTFEGLAWMVALYMSSIYLYRLVLLGLPNPNMRPGMFVAVGPPAFACLTLIGLSESLPAGYGYFGRHPMSIEILQVIALFVGIFLWSLALWFFCVAVLGVLIGASCTSFHLVWWAFIFPSVGLTLATAKIGQQLESPVILWMTSIATIVITMVWIFIFICQVRAIWRREIWMPGKDEDKDQYLIDDIKANIKVPPWQCERDPSRVDSHT